MQRVFLSILVVFCALSIKAQEVRVMDPRYIADSLEVKASFKINEYSSDDNSVVTKTLERVKELVAEGAEIQRINVSGRSSIDGPQSTNLVISQKRAAYVADLISKQAFLKDFPVTSTGIGEDWENFEKLIEDSNLTSKDEILRIIRSSRNLNDKEALLKTMNGGAVWSELKVKILPHLRISVIYIIWKNAAGDIVEEMVEQEPVDVIEEHENAEPEPTVEPEPVVEVEPVAEPVAEPVQEVIDSTETAHKQFVAIKNNLVLTGALIANIGAEASVGNHFSVALPVAWSPYTVGRNWRLRTMALAPEFRWWIKEGWQGHFLGVQAHMAYYNISTIGNRQERFQDREGKHPLLGAGINYGYALPFGRNKQWGVEFTAGIGYAYLDYDVFYNIDNGVQHDTGTKHYLGLTNVGVTVFYRFFYNRSRK